jgi:glycosyltransferase involved in cell wall biosynthesis
MWAFTGGCHYAGACTHFMYECGRCPFLRDAGENDISHTGWVRKAMLYANAENITFVACSQWLASVARQSSLLKGHTVKSIPNPIDVNVFSPQDKAAIRHKLNISVSAKIILFGAANINDRRKGISYLVDALNILKSNYPGAADAEVVIFGKNKHFDVSLLPFKVHELKLITSQLELAEIYAMADMFVTPALEDNLPNTVMEALACGTPVVAFNTGGIPEMVTHLQNGYLAEFKSDADLANGISEILYAGNAAQLSANARQKVLDNYINEKVAGQYVELYQSILK